MKRRSLLPAIRSPSSPEVEKDDLTPIILYVHGFPLEIFQRKIWSAHFSYIGMKNTWYGPAGRELPPRTLHPKEEGAKKDHAPFQQLPHSFSLVFTFPCPSFNTAANGGHVLFIL